MKMIRTQDAVGTVLCHDLTQIIVGQTKDARFRKGHIVTKEDIPVLLSMGKEHLYVWEADESMLHENEAAMRLCKLCQNEHMKVSEIKEGKVELLADCDGLLKVNRKALQYINAVGEMMIATRHGNTVVRAKDKLAGMRVIPLVIAKEKMERAEAACKEITSEPILELKPFRHKKIAVITTGSEVFSGKIQDTFTPAVLAKLAEYDHEIVERKILGDEPEPITEAILSAISEKKADIVLCTGGMSVDPDDRTPLAIRKSGAQIVSYGAPVLPGAMFMLGYLGKTTIMGLPGCVMYARRTIFDLVLARVMADDVVSGQELASLGEGGLCLNCENCTYPNCGFGKGW